MGSQKLGMRLELKQKPIQIQDMTDLQNVSAAAEKTAEKLVKKHNGNIKAIKNELLKTKYPKIKGFNYVKEVLWAVKWLIPRLQTQT
jgi:hypothetical protein